VTASPNKAGQLALEALQGCHKGGRHVGRVEVVQRRGLHAQPAGEEAGGTGREGQYRSSVEIQ
jgi:hypothetical protein